MCVRHGTHFIDLTPTHFSPSDEGRGMVKIDQSFRGAAGVLSLTHVHALMRSHAGSHAQPRG